MKKSNTSKTHISLKKKRSYKKSITSKKSKKMAKPIFRLYKNKFVMYI